jgi:PPK2 family polyphosphate:nucleotide phosphotransferase
MKFSEIFRVSPGTKIDLGKIDPGFTNGEEKEPAGERFKKFADDLRDLQYLLYAEGKQSLLIVLQGMDAAGKDGTITNVVGAMNPQGIRIANFKTPSTEELAHDFLWRVEKQAPAKGEVVIFNRSHYEDVLIVRVHNLVAREVWAARYDLINNFEKNLAAAGTHILKFFLHISQEEQLDRYKDRLEDPARQWKISEADYTERKFWNDYVNAYQDAIGKTSTSYAPWFVIPANRKWFRNFAISKIIIEKLESLGMKYPQPQVNLAELKRKYHEAVAEQKSDNKD